MASFLTEDFLLESDLARELYHHHAAKEPILDYHCHLSARQLAENKNFANLYQVWLTEDHYKWRIMRANGVPERCCTGDASDWEKYTAWAATLPYALRNPLYHWTHLEMKNAFGINDLLLGPDTAKEVWDRANQALKTPALKPREILKSMNVRALCTTDDPTDTLEYHLQLRADPSCLTGVFPTFRPDKAIAVENVAAWNTWIDLLATRTGTTIRSLEDFQAALKNRHQFFHAAGCRLSDHGLETTHAEPHTETEIVTCFKTLRQGKELSPADRLKFKSFFLLRFGEWAAEKEWTMQLHLGPLRNNRTRLFQDFGPDAGCDSMGDWGLALPLNRFLDTLDQAGKLPRMIFYNIHPMHSELLASTLGNFQDGTIPCKLQLGCAWWYLDQLDGILRNLETISNLSLLSRFVGMLTDSRSLLSYSRHEYFRRILCNLLGEDVRRGRLPNDQALLGNLVRDVSYRNAERYFKLPGASR